MKHLYIIALLLFCLFSCNSKNEENQALDQIEDIIYTYPDSAFTLLDSLKISSYNIYDQNRFFLYRVQAKDLAKKDISIDKEILDVYNYFKESKHDELIGLAALYAGRVLHSNKNYDEAIIYYNIAETSAVNRNDKEIQGYALFWTGMLMLDHYMDKEAKVKLAEAESVFIQTRNHEYEIKLYNNIGIDYLLSGENDSSLVYFNKALDLAIKYENRKEQARITQNIGVTLDEKKDFRKAVQTLLKAIDIDSTAHTSGKIYLNLAQAYLDLGKIDSARYYANSCLQKEDKKEIKSTNITATSYRILSVIEERINNYKSAFYYHKLYSENLAKILSENRNKAIIEAGSKYKFEAMQDENITLAVKHLEIQRILFLTFLLIAILTIIYYRKLLRKNKLLAQANEEILSITETAKESDRDNLNHNLEVLKRAASLEYSVQHSNNRQGKALIKQFNIIVYGQEMIDWNILYKIINSVHNGIFDKIKERYLNLDDTDFRICCLIYSKFNSNEIAAITQLSINTVYMKTTNIRKKLGIEKYGNLIEFFDEDINPSEN